MELATLLAFTGAWAALVVLPGPDTALVAALGVTRGRRVALGAALGSCTALLLHVTAAGLGLSALLAQSATAFTVLKLAGAAYLVVLGLRLILADDAPGGEGPAPAPAPPRRPRLRLPESSFARGLMTGALNPKSAIFFLTFLPQFVDPDAAVAPQFLALGAVTVGLAALWLGVLILAAGGLRRMASTPRVRVVTERLTGTVFVVLGSKLASATR